MFYMSFYTHFLPFSFLSLTNPPPHPPEEAFPHLTTRDPTHFWTSGQWMTERPGGSDVGRTETEASLDPLLASSGDPLPYRVNGFKWFSSATDSNMTLLLARERDERGEVVEGSRGLSLFYAPVRMEGGALKWGKWVGKGKGREGKGKRKDDGNDV